MTIVARYSFDVPFGRKPEVFRAAKKWRALEQELGFPKAEVLVGSVGTPESRVETQYRFESMAALEAVFMKVGKDPRMSEYQKEMSALIVPGSHRWDILRVQET
jgi:hypothetical protein